MSDKEMQITTADRLEIVAIVAGGGNGVEYVEVCGLIETAAKELREKDAEILRLRDENSKSKSLINELLDYAESLEGRLDNHDLGMLEDVDIKSRARAVRENIKSRFSPKSAQQIRDETDRLIEKHRQSVNDWLEAGSWKQSGAESE